TLSAVSGVKAGRLALATTTLLRVVACAAACWAARAWACTCDCACDWIEVTYMYTPAAEAAPRAIANTRRGPRRPGFGLPLIIWSNLANSCRSSHQSSNEQVSG